MNWINCFYRKICNWFLNMNKFCSSSLMKDFVLMTILRMVGHGISMKNAPANARTR